MEEQKLSPQAQERHQQLLTELQKHQLDIPPDSKLAWEYIMWGDQAGTTNVQEICTKLAIAKYLHEYANFNLGYQFAIATIRYRGQKFPKEEWVQIINRCVLLTTKTRQFPNPWPWVDGITPDEWKKENDVSAELFHFDE